MKLVHFPNSWIIFFFVLDEINSMLIWVNCNTYKLCQTNTYEIDKDSIIPPRGSVIGATFAVEGIFEPSALERTMSNWIRVSLNMYTLGGSSLWRTNSNCLVLSSMPVLQPNFCITTLWYLLSLGSLRKQLSIMFLEGNDGSLTEAVAIFTKC